MNHMLTDKEIEAVQDILIEQLDVRRDQLTPDAALKNDLGADSLDETEIILALEVCFSLSIPDERAEGVHTVADTYELISELLGRNNARVRSQA